MRDRSPPKSRDDTQVFSFANDLQTFFPREETQRQEYRTRNGKVIFRMISVFAWRRGFNVMCPSQKVTKYQWDVYDFILKIPRGKVTTYKTISECIGGSARSGEGSNMQLRLNVYSCILSVGGTLRINPFAPYVPCHRVVASNLFIGGFCGQWAGRKSASQKSEDKGQDQIRRKVGLLKEEGIEVDGKGFLLDRESVIWCPSLTTD